LPELKYLSLFVLFIVLFNSINLFGQEDVQIGKSLKSQLQTYRGAYFDYSDPDAINIKVLVWGNVEFPGEYFIPASNSVNDLLALAGGPTTNAQMDDLRIFRVGPDSVQHMIKFDYNDLLWNDKLTKQIKIPTLQAGDILLVPGEPRFFFRDYFSITLSIVSALTSIAILLVTIYK
jgi:protein involved in polysaccharide export with SLBB domain